MRQNPEVGAEARGRAAVEGKAAELAESRAGGGKGKGGGKNDKPKKEEKKDDKNKNQKPSGAPKPTGNRPTLFEVCPKYMNGKGGCDGKCGLKHCDMPICWGFKKGACKFGENCRLAHDKHILVREPGKRTPDGKFIIIDYTPKDDAVCRVCKKTWAQHPKKGWCAPGEGA